MHLESLFTVSPCVVAVVAAAVAVAVAVAAAQSRI